MRRSVEQTGLPLIRAQLFLVYCFLLLAPRGSCQDSSSEGVVLRGDKAEISITVRDSSGEPISAPASVKLYHDGIPVEQGATSHGRAFFIPRALGAFTIVVEATGYKSAQKDVSI